MKFSSKVLFLILGFVSVCSCSDRDRLEYEQIIPLNDWLMLIPGEDNQDFNNIRKSSQWIKINSLSDVINKYEGQPIWVRTTLPDWKGPAPAVYISQVDYSLQVYLNDKLVYTLGNDSSGKFYIGRNQGIVPLPGIKAGDELTIRIFTGKYWVNRQVVLGSALALFRNVFFFDLNNLLFAVLFLVTGLLSVLLLIFFNNKNLFAGLFLFLVSLGLLMVANSSFIHLVFNLPRLFYHQYYICMICSGIGGFLIIRSLAADRYKRIMSIIISAHLALLIFSIIFLHLTDFRFIEIVPYYFALVTISVLISMTILFKGSKSSSYNVNILAGGIAVYSFFVILEFVLQFASSYDNTYGYRIEVVNYGVLLFIVSVIWVVVDEYLKSLKQKVKIQELELENVRRENESRHSFAASLMKSQESERNRIALELHDSVGQKLLLMKNQLQYKIKNSGDESAGFLTVISGYTSDLINEIRSIIYNLRPQHLDQLGLKTAIETMVEKFSEFPGIKFHSSIEDINDILDENEEINLYRIIQESLNNIIRHSHATDAFLNITNDGRIIVVKISDNGTGFDSGKSAAYSCFGLTGIRERGRMLGAELDISSEKDKGTLIELKYTIKKSIPVEEAV